MAELLRGLRRSDPYERVAAGAALVCIGGLMFPWYRAPFSRRLSQNGLDGFGFAEAALLLTAAAALLLILQGAARGRRLPLPLHEGTLLAIAGAWSAVIVTVLLFDRPRIQIGAFDTDYGLAFGLFVELGASVVLAVAGWQLRGRELRRDARGEPRGPERLNPEAAEARSPSAPFPARSPRSPS
jgi:hypothetical protein